MKEENPATLVTELRGDAVFFEPGEYPGPFLLPCGTPPLPNKKSGPDPGRDRS